MNDLVVSPFAGQTRAVAETAGSRQTQHRELAETQAKYLMAQHFPRDVVAVTDRIINAFTRPSLAEHAEYSFARGGSDISGPSIRAAEAIAQQWQNMEFGFREISRGIGPDNVPFSEVEAFAVDIENRTRRALAFIVRHWRDRKNGGGYKLTDERDIYELCANQAQRRVRACILALLPGDVVEAAMQQATATLKARVQITPELLKGLLEKFAQHGVTQEQIEKRIQRRLDTILPAQVVQLGKVFNALRDGVAQVGDFFEVGEQQERGTSGLDAVREATAAAKAAAPADAKPAPKAAEPPMSFAEIEQAMRGAKSIDDLDALAGMIQAFPREQQPDLSAEYGRLRKKLTKE